MVEVPMVTGLIEPGRRLLERVAAEGIEVTTALWAFREGGDQPYLCIVTPRANAADTRPLYSVINRLIDRLAAEGHETVDWASVMLLSSDRPVYHGAARLLANLHAPGRWLSGEYLGIGGLYGAYVYAPIPAPVPTPA